MVELTQSMQKWLWDNNRDLIPLIMMGHTELLTTEMWKEYIVWCKTDEGKKYLKSGSEYKEEIGTDEDFGKAMDQALQEVQEARSAEKNHINEVIRPRPIFHQKAVNGCVEKKHEFSITICSIGSHTVEATLSDLGANIETTIFIKCLELNKDSFFKYAGEAIDRLSEKIYYTGKVVCTDVYKGATNFSSGKIYEI